MKCRFWDFTTAADTNPFILVQSASALFNVVRGEAILGIFALKLLTLDDHTAQPAHSASACSNTVCVAFSCLSGG